MSRCYCPDLTEADEKEWDYKEFTWHQKSFYIVSLPMLFNIPTVMAKKIEKALAEIEEKGYKTVRPHRIISRDGWFSGQLLVEIEGPLETGPRIFTFRNTKFVSKVFRGKNHLLSRAVKDYVFELEQKGKVTTEIYYWYVTCPACVKEKGYKTIILAQLE